MIDLKNLPINRPTLDDPLYSQKNPHQTFLLVFSLYAAAPLLTGRSAGSAVLSEVLNQATLVTWGLCLLIGSLVALVGEFWPGRTWDGLVLERTGVGLVGLGALLYSGVVFFTVDSDTRYVVGVTTAYGLSCVWRVAQITKRLRWIRSLILETNAIAEKGNDT